MLVYGSVEYWDHRYKATQCINDGVDWYQRFTDLKRYLSPLSLSGLTHSFPSREDCRVLIVGCGSSPFGHDMRKDGWTGPMIQIDYSSVIVEQMQRRHPDMHYYCLDATKRMPYSDGSFDLIVVKGTLDAVLCSAGGKAAACQMIAEIFRLLAYNHGTLFLVSSSAPDNRREILEVDGSLEVYWSKVNMVPIESNGSSMSSKKEWLYICRKRVEDTNKENRKMLFY